MTDVVYHRVGGIRLLPLGECFCHAGGDIDGCQLGQVLRKGSVMYLPVMQGALVRQIAQAAGTAAATGYHQPLYHHYLLSRILFESFKSMKV